MAQTIKLKRSATQNAVPSTSSLALGELAINTYDGKLFIKKNVSGTESIVTIGEVGAGSIGANELASSGVTAGSYGSTSAIPVITIDADGRITSASTATISGLSANSVTSTEIAANAVGISELNVSDGTDGQVLTTDGNGNLAFEDQSGGAASATAFSTNIASGDGSTTAFTLSESPSAESKIIAFINGVFQNQDAYTISGTTLTFDTAPISGTNNVVVYVIGDVYSGESVLISNFSGNGTTTAFTLANNPGNENNTQVYIDGVYQQKTTYSVSGTTLTFSSAPPTGTNNIEVVMLTSTTVNTPAAGSVVTASMADDSVTASKIVSSAVTTAKIADSNVTTAKIADDAVTIGKIADAALVIESEGIGSNDNDTTLPTSAAVKDYVDTQVAGKDALSELSGDTDDVTEGSTNLYYTDARVGTYISGNRTYGNITTTGYIAGPSTFTIDPAAVGDNTGTLVIAGNLQVDGTTTTINSTTLTVDDKRITLASGSLNAAAADGAGIEVEISGATYPSIKYDGTNDEWDFNKPINLTGDGHDLLINSADYELVLLGNRGSTGVNLDKAYLRMKAEGTNTVVIDTAGNSYFNGGNVGIGTSSPSGVLHVKGGGNELYLERSLHDIMALGIGTVNSQKGLHITNQTDSVVPVSLHENAPAGTLVIDSSGRVGIGTTSPTTQLNVRGSSTTGSIDVQGSDSTIQGRFYSDNSGQTLLYADRLGNAVSPALRFYVGTSERMRIDSTGNVGINETSPTSYGNSQATLVIKDSTGPAIAWNDTGQTRDWFAVAQGSGLHFNYADGGGSGGASNVTSALLLDNSGKVGIGIEPTEGQLHIKSDSSGEVELLTLENSTGTNGKTTLTFKTTSTDSTKSAQIFAERINASGHTDLAFRTFNGSTSEAVRIDHDGNVGIGTNSPDGLLHISSGTAGDAILILESDTDNDNEADNPQIWLKGDGDITKGAIRVTDNQLELISNVNAASGIKFYVGSTNNTGTTDPGTSATQRMFINENGRVHIGHSTETGWDSLGTLVVQQAAADRGLGVVDAGGNNTFQFINNNTTAKINHNLGSADIEIGTGGNHKLYIKGSTSDVGIGTNAPNGYRLEVYDGDYTQMMLRGPTYPMLRFKADNQNSGNNALLGVGAGNSFTIQPNNTTNGIIVSNSGHVTMPNQPAFHAYGPSAAVADGNVVVYANTYVNTGSHYSTSNGRFTAPVAGVYLFFWSAIGNNTNDVYRWFLHKNGSATGIGSNDVHLRQDTQATGSEYATNGSRVQMVSLSANDYVHIYFDSDSGTSAYYQSDYVNFGGYLIG